MGFFCFGAFFVADLREPFVGTESCGVLCADSLFAAVRESAVSFGTVAGGGSEVGRTVEESDAGVVVGTTGARDAVS